MCRHWFGEDGELKTRLSETTESDMPDPLMTAVYRYVCDNTESSLLQFQHSKLGNCLKTVSWPVSVYNIIMFLLLSWE